MATRTKGEIVVCAAGCGKTIGVKLKGTVPPKWWCVYTRGRSHRCCSVECMEKVKNGNLPEVSKG